MTGPLGPERLDLLFAMLMMTIVNINSPKGKAPKKLEDFIPRWDADAPKEPQHPAEMRRILWSLNERRNAR